VDLRGRAGDAQLDGAPARRVDTPVGVLSSFLPGVECAQGSVKAGGRKPKIICHIDVCESLWAMGVRSDQLKGYFGGDPTDWNQLCHAEHCSSAHFETMRSINLPGEVYKLDMAVVSAIDADVIIDQAYCYGEECFTNVSVVPGLLKYSGAVPELEALGIPVINVNVAGRSYLAVIESFQRLAIAMGDSPNLDLDAHCHEMQAAIRSMEGAARRLWAEGIRTTAISVASLADEIYAAEPSHDPILIMLEEIGVPVTHIAANDPRGGYWEYIPFNGTGDGTSPITDKYPTDIWLYDARYHDALTREAKRPWTFDDPGWYAGQLAPWSIDSSFSYERATRILNTLRNKFNSARRIRPKTLCTLGDVTARPSVFAAGQWACHEPKHSFPKCACQSTFSAAI
jgi:hypothetical protein